MSQPEQAETKTAGAGAAEADAAAVVIAGGGIAGLALAAALARTLKPAFALAVCDPALAREPAADDRVSAITAGARHLLEVLEVWPQVAAAAQPIREMVITDSRLEDAVRAPFLTFADETAAAGEPLAHMVEHRALALALRAAVRAEGVRLLPAAAAGFAADEDRIEVHLAGGRTFAARLLVAADGAHSKLRARAGIQSVTWPYRQSGIVATIGHERDHQGRATQHFLPAGSFAMLPLSGRRSSIVWTEATAEAQRIVALPAAAFRHELLRRFGHQLGDVEVLSPARAYPLSFAMARRFVGERLALLGDAAHVIHPLAGQGLNLGLRDAAALAESIVDAARLGLDPGGPEVLKRYERWRRFDTLAMASATDGLNRLFSNRSEVLRAVRDVGLGVVERTPALRRLFAGEAGGVTAAAPKLLRGETL